jgi:hypothetical protein
MKKKQKIGRKYIYAIYTVLYLVKVLLYNNQKQLLKDQCLLICPLDGQEREKEFARTSLNNP